jgi:hypothetical protein
MQTSELIAALEPSPVSSGPPAAPDIKAHLREALGLLLQAYEYAAELGQSAWDMAVEIEVLRDARLTHSDLRWLAAKGYVAHAIEISTSHDSARRFRHTALLRPERDMCFILTETGVALAREATLAPAAQSTGAQASNARGSADGPGLKWDQQRRQLRVGNEVVKEFKLPSPNQETVLMAFDEESWPPRIDDPLPPVPEIDSRRRLHDTIKALNRKQKRALVRFMGDGTGEGIRWELRSDATAATTDGSVHT